jgi:hypothetical protein
MSFIWRNTKKISEVDNYFIVHRHLDSTNLRDSFKNARTELALSQKIATDTDALTSMLKNQADGDNYN